MPHITALPCEVIIAVLRKLGHVRFLLPTLLTCRHFYLSYKENPSVALDILGQQITSDLLPYSIAASEALRLPRPQTQPPVKQLLDALYDDPDSLMHRLRAMPLAAVIEMGSTHDLIENFANAFASDAWALLGQPESLVLSTTERFRVYRAFYRVELFLRLFRGKMSQADGALEDQQVQLFMSRHPPWVNEQLGCVHDYLENRFSKATRDVLYHDIEFGELSIDYISNGPLNFWKQLWISQGIKFISRVENAKSYDNQQALLTFAFGISNVPLHDALTKSYNAIKGLT